jgi:Uma2 family endonuclease
MGNRAVRALKVRRRDDVCKNAMAECAPGSCIVWREFLRPLSYAEQIMGMPAHAQGRPWTEEEFYAAREDALPGDRWELVDGEVLVTPSPNWVHQRIVVRLTILLDAYVRPRGFGEVFPSPLDVKLEPGLVLQPDMLVVPAGELRRRSDIVRRLLLAAEVVSPSSARFDRVKKRPHYQRHRVSEYWIVDDRSQTIERWTPDDDRPELLSEKLLWHPAGVSEPFVLDLVQFFEDVAAED